MKSTLHPVVTLVALIFATSVLVISLMSASVSNSMLRDNPASSRVIRFSTQIVPGHILYPLTVLRDKLALSLMGSVDQCLERLDLARERLSQAKQLIELGDTVVALETIVKGQRYLADAVDQCQRDKLAPEYKQSIRIVIQLYQQELEDMKQYYPDTDRAVIDQLLSENDALLKKVGGE